MAIIPVQSLRTRIAEGYHECQPHMNKCAVFYFLIHIFLFFRAYVIVKILHLFTSFCWYVVMCWISYCTFLHNNVLTPPPTFGKQEKVAFKVAKCGLIRVPCFLFHAIYCRKNVALVLLNSPAELGKNHMPCLPVFFNDLVKGVSTSSHLACFSGNSNIPSARKWPYCYFLYQCDDFLFFFPPDLGSLILTSLLFSLWC